MNIPFNKPYFSGREAYHISLSAGSGKISGNGIYTQKCQQFFEQRYGFKKALLTNSGTDALEMAAILSGVGAGDEVIIPSYTFVSTANAFVLRGADIIFADSNVDNPNIDESSIESLITPRTKVIVVVHYGGMACDMDKILALAHKYNLLIVEDAAHGIDSYYKGQPLGSIGHLAAFSFHETKNITCGEGGMLVVNDERFAKRAEIIWEKGTNRAAFYRGEVDKYGWVDIGSSFLPSDLSAAFLYGQLEKIDEIQAQRINIFNCYYEQLIPLVTSGNIKIPEYPKYATKNGHIFYLLTKSIQERTLLIGYLKQKGIHAVFHYLPLHQSPYFADKYKGNPLIHSELYANSLLRLPFFFELSEDQVYYICSSIKKFYGR